MTGFAEHYPDRERFRELMDEVSFGLDVASTSMSGLIRQVDQLMKTAVRGRVSTRDLPPVDHRMLGRPPLFPEPAPVTNMVTEPAPVTNMVTVPKPERPWYPPPLTSADLYADWQYRCAQHAKQRY